MILNVSEWGERHFHDVINCRNCLDCGLEDVAINMINEVPFWTSKSPSYLYNLTSDKKAT